MSKELLNYLLEEEGMTEKAALQVITKLERHLDIIAELSAWIKSRQYPERDAISVEGYTAQRLSEMTYLHPVGSYTYLVFLREDPQEALKALKNGLPRK